MYKAWVYCLFRAFGIFGWLKLVKISINKLRINKILFPFCSFVKNSNVKMSKHFYLTFPLHNCFRKYKRGNNWTLRTQYNVLNSKMNVIQIIIIFLIILKKTIVMSIECRKVCFALVLYNVGTSSKIFIIGNLRNNIFWYSSKSGNALIPCHNWNWCWMR